MTPFGDRIREARIARKLSQRVLAEAVGINFTYLSKLENGENPPPSEEKIYALAEHLQIDADELFTLAQRVPEDLTGFAMRAQMPQILRASKELSEKDLEDMLKWTQKRSKASEEKK